MNIPLPKPPLPLPKTTVPLPPPPPPPAPMGAVKPPPPPKPVPKAADAKAALAHWLKHYEVCVGVKLQAAMRALAIDLGCSTKGPIPEDANILKFVNAHLEAGVVTINQMFNAMRRDLGVPLSDPDGTTQRLVDLTEDKMDSIRHTIARLNGEKSLELVRAESLAAMNTGR